MSLKERINLVKQQLGMSEVDTLNIEKALGKKLVDYESIDALVAALMGYYNEELKKKANTSHTHDYEPKITPKNTAFNKDFGTTNNTVLEGAKLAEILGLTYGGSLNNSNTKTLNYAYYDNTTKKVYKCIKSTTLNYADSSCFEAISNNDLLGKF